MVLGGSGAATRQYRNRSAIGELSFACLQPLGLRDEPLEGEVIVKQYRAQGLRGALGVYTLIAAPLKTARAFLCFGQTA